MVPRVEIPVDVATLAVFVDDPVVLLVFKFPVERPLDIQGVTSPGSQ